METLEELLNKLIKKGWKPFGWDNKLSSLHKEYGVGKWYIRFHNGMDSELFDLRQLTSKESGLWQFVYDNGYNQEKKEYREGYTKYNMKAEYWDTNDYEYYIIESALCDEDKLEEFLLENIKL